MRTAIRSLAALGAVLALGSAQAETFGFGCVTNNIATDCALAENQLSVSFSQGVTSGGQSYLEFTFLNSGEERLSLTDVYFDWGPPAPVSSVQGTIVESAGVNFEPGADPGNLPGGKSIDFVANVGLTADSEAPRFDNGVNAANEFLTFRFLSGYTNTLQDLYSGALRIGVHVQGFDSGGSESLVAVAAPAPEPGAVALMLAGLGAVGFAARRRRNGAGKA